MFERGDSISRFRFGDDRPGNEASCANMHEGEDTIVLVEEMPGVLRIVLKESKKALPHKISVKAG